MRLANYEFAESLDKKEWLNSMQMKVGLSYFGGKSVIGKYIFNNIFNLSVEMKKRGRKPEIFIDAFTGGGKMGLSVPYGWYDTIVMNDINYGVYSYYKCCQSDDYIALIYMIEKIGELMSRDLFHVAAYLRNFGINVDKWDDGKDFVTEDEVLDPLVAAALTYWVTVGAFNGMTAPDSTSYKLTKEIGEGDNKQDDKSLEQENIKKVIKRAYKNIPKIHEQLNKQHYIIENLDYRELIKKYNGMDWHDCDWMSKERFKDFLQERNELDEKIFDEQYEEFSKEHTHKNLEYANKNKLWYFDPPYHPWCLYAGENAPYADTFSAKLANEMIDILHGDKEEEFGKIEYFIKSDYDPEVAYNTAKTEVNNHHDGHQLTWYRKLIDMEEGREENKNNFSLNQYEKDMIWKEGMVTNLFKKIETYPFCKICVGGFDKGALLGKENESRKSVGQEYIWCRGFSKGYEEIEGEPAKE